MPTTTPADVRAWRARLDWTLEQAGEALSVDKQTVHRWERGANPPPAYLILALDRIEQLEAEKAAAAAAAEDDPT